MTIGYLTRYVLSWETKRRSEDRPIEAAARRTLNVETQAHFVIFDQMLARRVMAFATFQI